MSAIIRVVLDEALKPITTAEYAEWPRMCRPTNCWDELNDTDKTNVMLANRRARLLPPSACVEDRYKVAQRHDGHWGVEFLGAFMPDADFIHRENAEALRVGLIAKLKKEENR